MKQGESLLLTTGDENILHARIDFVLDAAPRTGGWLRALCRGNGSGADAFCLLCVGDEIVDVVGFQQPISKNGSVRHVIDDMSLRDGEGEPDDESIYIDFERVPDAVGQLLLVVHGDTFLDISSISCRVGDRDRRMTLGRYRYEVSVPERENTLFVGVFVRENGCWAFQSLGQMTWADTFADIFERGRQIIRGDA